MTLLAVTSSRFSMVEDKNSPKGLNRTSGKVLIAAENGRKDRAGETSKGVVDYRRDINTSGAGANGVLGSPFSLNNQGEKREIILPFKKRKEIILPIKKRKEKYRDVVIEKKEEVPIVEEETKMKTTVKGKRSRRTGPKKRKNNEGHEVNAGTKREIMKKNKLTDGARCTRVNGLGWRCRQLTHVGHSLCEYHLGQARRRMNMSSIDE
ncbi:hypothetical protein GIB67_040257 [Kingdonia uniflora]|uniref:WRC domain-containing protein n=1 Tax=Kingdonia uniflora TaxID=39325 RepID=A0A7J7MV24_9MAGN|nr:hypothetical protein GIB67_040257 [Kingdonia uniflora]